MSNELKSNEIWLEGQTLEIAKYRKLFKVYGTTWGGDGTTTFGVPDFRNRAIWGSGDGTFGYIEAGLPNIKTEYEHGICRVAINNYGELLPPLVSVGTSNTVGNGNVALHMVNIDISTINSVYGNSTTVQPPSIKIRVKCRAKY